MWQKREVLQVLKKPSQNFKKIFVPILEGDAFFAFRDAFLKTFSQHKKVTQFFICVQPKEVQIIHHILCLTKFYYKTLALTFSDKLSRCYIKDKEKIFFVQNDYNWFTCMFCQFGHLKTGKCKFKFPVQGFFSHLLLVVPALSFLRNKIFYYLPTTPDAYVV